MIRELKILTEALWESIKQDLKYFAAIQSFVKRLADNDFLNKSDIEEAKMCIEHINGFFQKNGPKAGKIAIVYPQIDNNRQTVRQINVIINNLSPYLKRI